MTFTVTLSQHHGGGALKQWQNLPWPRPSPGLPDGTGRRPPRQSGAGGRPGKQPSRHDSKPDFKVPVLWSPHPEGTGLRPAHTHPHAFTHIHTHSHVSTRIHMHAHASTHIHTHPHAFTRIHSHPHVSTRIHSHPHASTCIHAHPHVSTHIHTHAHTSTWVPAPEARSCAGLGRREADAPCPSAQSQESSPSPCALKTHVVHI